MTDPFDYCIAGLGNVGILFAYFLRKKKVVAISRRAKGDRERVTLKHSGAILWSDEILTRRPEDFVKCKKVLITLKAYDVPWALSFLKDKGEIFIVMSNGLGLFEEAVRLHGKDRALGGTVTYGLTSCGEYCSELRGIGQVRIGGSASSEAQKNSKEMTEDLISGGCSANAVEDIIPHIWLKGIINSAINPITTLLKKPNKILLENPHAVELAELVVKEGKEVANKKGIDLASDPFKEAIEVAKKTGENFSSMLQDIMARRKTEIDYINGYLASEGMKLNVNAKANLSLYLMIKAMERDLGIH
jgi:2-dehydropantoate 2-reductase|uniref:2-dehydropantoate 2-reductase n=1 Tax=Fervidicoccus fontis TaxID=683846 RepID=A0A7J3SLE7_9CREN